MNRRGVAVWAVIALLEPAMTYSLASPAAAAISAAALKAAQNQLAKVERKDAPDEVDGLRYPRARMRLRRLGYDPVAFLSREKHSDCTGEWPNSRCARWPEVEACSVKEDCIFYWRRRRDGQLLLVQTESTRHGDIVMDERWGTRGNLCSYRFAAGLTFKTLPDPVPPVDPAKPCGPRQEVR